MTEEIRRQIEHLANRMSSVNTPDERKEMDELFAKLNATLTPEEKREGGRIMREALAAKRAARRAKRTDTWLYHRINGTLVNGKPAAFTDEELKVFSDALRDIGSKISESSLSIR